MVRVLIVDDQPYFRHVARELLELRGYTVVGEAGCAASALDAVARLRPDAVLLDVCLGPDDGHEVARELARLDPRPAVLMVSTTDHGDQHLRARASGARGFVLKTSIAAADLRRFWPPPPAGA
jgi:two-component system nitrate/nitrite response regulator NarL